MAAAISAVVVALISGGMPARAAESTYAFTHLAGPIAGAGSADGVGAVARFTLPHDVTVDAAGNVYVADTGNSVLRKIAPNGTVTTFAGAVAQSGSADGTGATARFDHPARIVVDAVGNLYVTDAGNHTLRKVTAAGAVTTIAGSPGQAGSADGVGAAARFSTPRGVAVDAAGNVFVTDADNQLVRRVDAHGVVTTMAGAPGQVGSADGAGAAARFNHPEDVVLDASGNLFVSDCFNHTIRKITPAGVVSTFAGTPGLYGDYKDGAGASAAFLYPSGLAFDAAGNLFVADSGNCAIRRISPTGIVATMAAGGPGSADGAYTFNFRPPGYVAFQYPTGVAVDATGNVFVADEMNHTIRKMTAVTAFQWMVSTFAGTAAGWSFNDGVRSAARFNDPSGIVVDGKGNVYVADRSNYVLRKITPDGTVTTLAGYPRVEGATDGKGANARFRDPTGLGLDAAGNLLVADGSLIRRVSVDGVVTTLAGSPTTGGDVDGMGPAARLSVWGNLGVDASGNIYAAQQVSHTIRKITASGVVTTFAGEAGSSGATDGVGTAARFNAPSGTAVDAAGNVYVADSFNDTVRKITPAGVVSTLAGLAGAPGSADGVGSNARFFWPSSVAVDAAGNVFVSERVNSTIRRISPDGTVTTLAGIAGYPANTDGVGAAARFTRPMGIAVDAAGSVFVADTDNYGIRKGATHQVAPSIDWPRPPVVYYGTPLTAAHLNATANVPGTFVYSPSAGTSLPVGAQTLTVSFTPADAVHYEAATSQVTVLVLALTPVLTQEPQGKAATAGSPVTLNVEATGSSEMSYRWWHSSTLTAATGASLTISHLQPADTGLYTAEAIDGAGSTLSKPAIVGLLTTSKVVGAGDVIGTDIRHPNGRLYDQVLLTGTAETITAEAGKVTRTSFIDYDGDIVQVEFAGAGALSLVLDFPSGPAAPVNYQQPGVRYMSGHAGIVIVGADETTNVSVFAVGRATAFDPGGTYDFTKPISATNDPAKNGSPLFEGHQGTRYDGIADIGFIAIASADGKFGGVRTGNAVYADGLGLTGLYAPDVTFVGPVFIGDIRSSSNARAVLLVGKAEGETRITGGDLFQERGKPVEVSGLTQLKFTAGTDAGGSTLPAQRNRAMLQQNGVDVTAQIAVNPP